MSDMSLTWDRVMSARMPRVATQQTTHRIVRAAKSPVLLQGFYRILRTGRVKTALLAKKRAESKLICFNHHDK